MTKKSLLGLAFAVLCANAGFIGCKTLTATYLDANGEPFKQTGTFFLWQEMPYSFNNDTFAYSEVIQVYRKAITTYTAPVSSNLVTSANLREDGSSNAVTYRANEGKPSTAIVNVYKVTVTRYWYNRITYYQNKLPTASRVYADKESSVLIDSYTQ